MMNRQSTIAAALLSLALAVPAAWAESNSEKELNAATFSESESQTQVREEKAIEQKDGMNAPQGQSGGPTQGQAMDAATEAAGATPVPK